MTRPLLLWIAAILAIAFLLIPPLHHGWTHVETDFPNYDTAARMARQHQPLRDLYDWTTFQRRMNYAGWGRQLGGYIPHTSLTALPMIPLAAFPPMTAKRCWLALSIAFLAAAICILGRITKIPVPALIVLALAGHNAVAGNLELGQYYFFLLFLLTLSVWLLLTRREIAAGLLLGAILILKLYAGPFLLYFAWKRRWRALSAMLLAAAILALASIAWFGWRDHLYYLTDILPRAAAGEHIDPYAPGMPTLLNMIRHPLEREAQLNPNPLFDAPAIMFFLQTLLTASLPLFCLIALPRQNSSERRDLAWFLVMLVLVSPSRAFYAAILLLLPIALLLKESSMRMRIFLIAAYLAVTNALPDSWAPFFPTVWILIAFYITVGIPYWRNLRAKSALALASAIVSVASFSSYARMTSYHREPPQVFERVAFEPGAIYSSTPGISAAGAVYESIDEGRYLLKLSNRSGIQRFTFAGQAFHPTMAAAGGAIYFELVADQHSSIMAYDPATKKLRELVSSAFEPTHPSASPDGQRLAFISNGRILVSSNGGITAVSTPTPVYDVAWFPDSSRLVFAAGPDGRAHIFATTSAGSPMQLTSDAADHREPAISPDGRWLALTIARSRTRQIWIQNLATASAAQLTEGVCNSFAPAWQPDSAGIVFASDCQRGIGLPALFLAPLSPANLPFSGENDLIRPRFPQRNVAFLQHNKLYKAF